MTDDSRRDGPLTGKPEEKGTEGPNTGVQPGITRKLPDDVLVTRVLHEEGPALGSPFKTTRLNESEPFQTTKLNGNENPGTPEHQGESGTGGFTRVLNAEDDRVDAPLTLLDHGDLVADRYQVVRGPIGGYTGEADVFAGRDSSSDTDIVIKYYRPNLSPKVEVLQQLRDLAHPDIVRLLDYGDWGGRFYEVLEYCVGGSAIDFAPYTEEELKKFLLEIVNGLASCHTLGIVHRDIKPSNLFFRHPGKKDLVIGDFGVSSAFDFLGEVRTTKTHRFRTLHYAAPELLNRRQIGPKTDFYALGITLVHLLTGKSPFHDFRDDEAVISAHCRSEVPLPDSMSDDFRQLLSGLLRYSYERRWGFNQVMAWLKGEPILADDGRPDYDDPHVGKAMPYSRVPEATTPLELARYLHAFNATEDLFRGKISQWVNLFNARLSDRIDEIADNYTSEKELGVFKLRYVLDPTAPLEAAGRKIHTIEQLTDLLRSSEEEVLSAIEKLLWGKQLECWIEVVHNDAQGMELAHKIMEIRERLPEHYSEIQADRRKRLGVLSLRWLLDPAFPFQLADGVEISRPAELEMVLGRDMKLIASVQAHLFGGTFEEWLTQCFPNRENDCDFISGCRKRHAGNPKLGAYALRWRFCPDLPFPFRAGEHARFPKDLAALIDRNEESWKRGIVALSEGWIREWLVATGRLSNAVEFDRVMPQDSTPSSRTMEAVQHLLDPDLPWPRISADRTALPFGSIGMESSRTQRITFSNAGRGFLVGNFRLQGQGHGIAIDQESFEGGPVVVEVTADARGLPAGSSQIVTLVAEANGSRMEIPISFTAGIPWLEIFCRSLGVGCICAVVFGILRFIIGSSTGIAGPLWWISFENVEGYWFRHPDLILWAALLIGGVGGGLYYLIRMGGANKARRDE
ncbi:serine/threonine-protein kinase [Desulforhabdus sp. TSK]|uniref:serine/threonine-protein kinase n=1 Tax=Desulforhabdus sp. TSK TaxID=2925014 RepID=UPI001FC83070|nr:serine/threonine-protein kinase [Desulforhabdus sp. TSK]GKT09135.1 hypothetical protein DSTSK_24400 [Desulforhabdus sp. TSK]